MVLILPAPFHCLFLPFQYTGKWYEFENYFAVFQAGGRCVTADYTLRVDNTVIVNNTAYYPLSQEYRSTIGEAKGTDPTNPAKLGVRFSGGFGPYWVVSTDYDTYAVVWSCLERTIPFLRYMWNAQIMWILTRDRAGLSPSDKAAIYDMLRSKGLDPSKLNPTDQINCP